LFEERFAHASPQKGACAFESTLATNTGTIAAASPANAGNSHARNSLIHSIVLPQPFPLEFILIGWTLLGPQDQSEGEPCWRAPLSVKSDQPHLTGATTTSGSGNIQGPFQRLLRAEACLTRVYLCRYAIFCLIQTHNSARGIKFG
jgi:hypothetical protein